MFVQLFIEGEESAGAGCLWMSRRQDLTKLPPVPKFSEKTVTIPVDRHLVDLGKTVAVGPTHRHMIVVEEEAYLGGMSQIIKRDFFPDLAVLETEEAYLDAVERADLVAARAACQKLKGLTSFGEEDGPSLEQYRALVTSTDNQSFEELLERENNTKRIRYERVFGGPAALVDDPTRRMLLAPSKSDSSRLDRDKARQSKRIETANTRLPSRRLRPELLSEGGPEGQDDLTTMYNEIMKRHMSRKEDSSWETSSTASTRNKYDLVQSTPVIRPGVDATPLMTWGNVEATPQRLDQTPSRNVIRAKSTAVKRLIKATIGTRQQKETPFGFDTKTLRAKKATEDMLRAMASPILKPRTPGSTPRNANGNQTPDHKGTHSTRTPDRNAHNDGTVDNEKKL